MPKQDRRIQVRRAQRTYRLKKEATLQSTKARAAELENKIKRVAESLADLYSAARQSELHITHPALFRRIGGIHSLSTQASERHKQTTTLHSSAPRVVSEERHPRVRDNARCGGDSLPDLIFGYQVADKSSCKGPYESVETEHAQSEMSQTKKHREFSLIKEDDSEIAGYHPQATQDIERPFGTGIRYTYCFQETIFSRRLHRYCLEHAFRLFSDPRSDPTAIYRVFRLVPCIRDKAKMYPFFRRLVSGGVEDPLELSTLPFYCIGGAGTHYPINDDLGNPVYPSNMRLPRRVLGLLPMAEIINEAGPAQDSQRHLEIFGLGGQWFDCRDVEGYLRDQGVNLEGSSLFAEVCDTTLHTSVATNRHGSTQPGDSRVGGESELSLSGSIPISGLSAGSETVSADREGTRVDGSQKGRKVLRITTSLGRC